jgi:hypothetical protein
MYGAVTQKMYQLVVASADVQLRCITGLGHQMVASSRRQHVQHTARLAMVMNDE